MRESDRKKKVVPKSPRIDHAKSQDPLFRAALGGCWGACCSLWVLLAVEYVARSYFFVPFFRAETIGWIVVSLVLGGIAGGCFAVFRGVLFWQSFICGSLGLCLGMILGWCVGLFIGDERISWSMACGGAYLGSAVGGIYGLLLPVE